MSPRLRLCADDFLLLILRGKLRSSDDNMEYETEHETGLFMLQI
jgi:hypothetical protein